MYVKMLDMDMTGTENSVKPNPEHHHSGSEDLSNEDLESEIILYKSPLAHFIAILVFFISIALTVMLTISYPESVQTQYLGRIAGTNLRFSFPFFALVPIIIFAYLVHKLHDCVYTIARDYVRATHGLTSFLKADIQLEYRDLTGVEVERTVLGRIFNVGDLLIWGPMPTRAELELIIKGVRDPSRYRNIILARKKAAKAADESASSHEHGAAHAG